MGCYNKYGTIAVGAYMAHQPGSHPRAFTDQYYPRWDRGDRRGPKTWKDKLAWQSLWSFGCKISGSGGGTDGDPVVQPLGHGYEPFSSDGEGAASLKFLRGTCVDGSDVAVANATVQAFRTSDDTFAGFQDVSRLDGTYAVGSQFPGVNHYLVAYKAGSPDICGTTVDTLVPTNIDGT